MEVVGVASVSKEMLALSLNSCWSTLQEIHICILYKVPVCKMRFGFTEELMWISHTFVRKQKNSEIHVSFATMEFLN